MPASGSRFVVITPVRDEVSYVAQAVASMLEQTNRPVRWVIVDDGSSDGTQAALAELVGFHDWICVVNQADRGSRLVGQGVVAAFLRGYAEVVDLQFDFVCKLDMDIVLPSAYFETLLRRMESDPRLGTASGKPFYRDAHGARVSERIGSDMSVGAVKTYRRRCLEQIGGPVLGVMWDGIDCHRARIFGWKAVSWDDRDLEFEHLRPMGASELGMINGRKRWGRGQYFMGTGLLWMVASATFRAFRPPVIVGGAAMLWGYISAALHGLPRLDDPRLRSYLRAYHRTALLRGKATAVQLVERRYADVWNPLAEAGWASTLPSGDQAPVGE